MTDQPSLFAPGHSGEPPGWPTLDEYDGSAVTWKDWDEIPLTSHLDWQCSVRSCGNTRSDAGPYERPWISFGLVNSRIRLAAFWCGRCGHLVVYDREGTFREVWSTMQWVDL